MTDASSPKRGGVGGRRTTCAAVTAPAGRDRCRRWRLDADPLCRASADLTTRPACDAPSRRTLDAAAVAPSRPLAGFSVDLGERGALRRRRAPSSRAASAAFHPIDRTVATE